MFQNLIVNGFNYNDAEEKTVEIEFENRAEVNGTTMQDVFFLCDNGIGISDKNRENVFQIFKHMNPDNAYGGRTGADLSFVRKIVKVYGGLIEFVSQPCGTTFYFSLPLMDANAQVAPTKEEKSKHV